jgi:hypothetical protein
MGTITAFFHNHATKVIGFGSSVLGAISLVDATTLHLIEQALGPHKGHQVSSALLIIGGLGTAYRGFQNSKK